jgi:nicotinic acetylcholine receptor
VRFDPPFYSKTICPFDEAELFTHNTVVCGLGFVSWTYDGKQLDVNLVDNGVNSNYLEPRPNQKWSYVKSSSERTVKYYDCCPEPYISVQYDLTLQRVA